MHLLKRFPYLISLLAGIIFYIIASMTSEKLSDLLLNISASLFTIPIVLYSYEIIKEKIAKHSNKEVNEYVKMKIDSELLDLLNKLSPLVAKSVAPGFEKILVFLSMNKTDMKRNLSYVKPLAFHLATDWTYNEDQFSNLLANELIYNNMTMDERNMLVSLIKATRSIDYATSPKFYVAQEEPRKGYRIVNGNEFDKVSKFKNRYLLLKKSKRDNEFRVAAFNDINESKYKIDMLTPMAINDEGQKVLLKALQDVAACLDVWLKSRGEEFILDSKIYKLSDRRSLSKKR